MAALPSDCEFESDFFPDDDNFDIDVTNVLGSRTNKEGNKAAEPPAEDLPRREIKREENEEGKESEGEAKPARELAV